MLEDTIRQMIREEIAAYMQGGQAQPAQVAAPATTPPTPSAPPPVAMPQIPAAGPPVAAPPVAAPPVAAPVAGVPTLDEIRALANDFARAKPQDMHLFAAFMASKGVDTLANMPPDQYPACKAELQRLIGA